MPSRYLNKAIIQAASDCLRLAYLRVRDRESDTAPPLSSSDRVQLMYGQMVGEKARGHFPDGKLIQATNFSDAVTETKRALKDDKVTLFEAAFEFEGIGIRVDVLEKDGKKYDLFEVKSGLTPDKYFEDVAVQVHVLEGLGLKVRPHLMLLDKEATIASDSLFRIIDCSSEVGEALKEVRARLPRLQAALGRKKWPTVPFTKACKECNYLAECLPDLPEHNVFTLQRVGKKIDGLLDKGIFDLKELPEGFKLTEGQEIQVQSVQSGKPWVSKELRTALDQVLKYPLYFLDFEAPREPLPRFQGQHPYDLLPFQWSCHVVDAPGKEPRHADFLMVDPGDPRPKFVSSLLDCLGKEGSIVVYTHFEATAIKEMAKVVPAKEMELKALLPRLVDLCKVVENHYYHPQFYGSYSIKAVLPALVPELSYEGMEVADGMAAVWAWYEVTSGKLSIMDRERKIGAMREYCMLDTLAMVRVYGKLLGA